MPPDQKASQTRSTWFLMSPVIMVVMSRRAAQSAHRAYRVWRVRVASTDPLGGPDAPHAACAHHDSGWLQAEDLQLDRRDGSAQHL
jgi:hypothetical protein